MAEQNINPHAEDPNIVKGGPWGDGSAPDPEGDLSPAAPAQPARALHKGFSGEITTAEDLVKYTQNLETLLVQKSPGQPQGQSFQPQTPNAPAKGESFEELVYSDPIKAKQVLMKEFEEIHNQRDAQKNREETFWSDFYQKNPDLKDMPSVVQSVFKRDRSDFSDVRRFSSDTLVADHLAKEARSIIGLVKEKTGVRETRVDSSPAMTFGGSSGAPGGTGAPAPQKPISFSEQLVRMKNKRKH
jgi:hypothetical protein